VSRTSPALGQRAVWRAPGRVNLIGEHTDYNDGFALPFAIPAGVTAAVTSRPDETLLISSIQVQSTAEISMPDLAPGAVTGWAAYPAGVVWALAELAGERPGVHIHVDGDVPLGAGLSSSAALICSVASALNELWQLGLSPAELVAITRRAENDFVGAPTGGLDQLASLMCTRGHALLLDLRAGTADQVPMELAAADLAILVTDTREQHSHAHGGYAERRAACLESARLLGVDALRDIDITTLPEAERRLADPVLFRVTRHVVTENARVLETVELLRAGRVEAIGPLLDASHNSLRDDFAVSTPKLDAAVDAARTAGALGSRMTGGGFGGSTITLGRSGDVPAIEAAIARSYAHHGYRPPRSWAVQPAQGAARVD
jgi:galactokinase